VGDDLGTVPRQGVHPAERVFPVGVDEVPVEDVDEQGSGGPQDFGVEVGGVGELDVGHGVIIARYSASSS
jgi:hypothetical protein